MSRYHICQHGNCGRDAMASSHTTRVTTGRGTDKQSLLFCSEQHAMLWLKGRIEQQPWMVEKEDVLS